MEIFKCKKKTLKLNVRTVLDPWQRSEYSITFFFFLFWLCLWHVEVPRPRTEPEPQPWKHWILNPLGHQGTLEYWISYSVSYSHHFMKLCVNVLILSWDFLKFRNLMFSSGMLFLNSKPYILIVYHM